MRRMLTVAIFGALAALALSTPVGIAQTGPSSSDGTIEVGPDYNKGEPLPLETPLAAAVAPEAAAPAQIGEERFWLGLDDQQDALYLRSGPYSSYAIAPRPGPAA